MDQLNYVKKNLKIIGIYFVEKREQMGASWSSDLKPLRYKFRLLKTLKPESQNFLVLGLRKPQTLLNLGFKNTVLGLTLQNNYSTPSFILKTYPNLVFIFLGGDSSFNHTITIFYNVITLYFSISTSKEQRARENRTVQNVADCDSS